MNVTEILGAVEVARDTEPADISVVRGRLHEIDAALMEKQIRSAITVEKMLTIHEVAARLGTTEHNIREKCRNGAIPGAVKVGARSWRISASILEDFIRRGRA